MNLCYFWWVCDIKSIVSRRFNALVLDQLVEHRATCRRWPPGCWFTCPDPQLETKWPISPLYAGVLLLIWAGRLCVVDYLPASFSLGQIKHSREDVAVTSHRPMEVETDLRTERFCTLWQLQADLVWPRFSSWSLAEKKELMFSEWGVPGSKTLLLLFLPLRQGGESLLLFTFPFQLVTHLLIPDPLHHQGVMHLLMHPLVSSCLHPL